MARLYAIAQRSYRAARLEPVRAEEAQHFPGCVRTGRIGVRAIGRAARPRVSGIVNEPLLDARTFLPVREPRDRMRAPAGPARVRCRYRSCRRVIDAAIHRGGDN